MKLSTEGIRKTYQKRLVVNNVSIEIMENEIIGLLGPNGAGKTTTFYMVVGLVEPDNGKVILDNEDITGFAIHRRAKSGIGYLPQETSVFRNLTVEENILAILETLKLSRDERMKRCRSLLEEFGIGKLARQKAYLLSGGEKRRVEIARALVTSPRFILLDEPFSGIDPITVGEIQQIILHLKKKGMGILITDHNVRETLEIVDRAYIIYEGEIMFQGSAKELLESKQARDLYLGPKFKA